MKKYLSILFLILCGFFFFDVQVNAKAFSSKFSINYDINEHFNFFYEQKNNTPFYQFLMSYGPDGIFEQMCSFLGYCDIDMFKLHQFRIFSYNDYVPNVDGPAYDGAKYVFYYSSGSSGQLVMKEGKYFIDTFASGDKNNYFFVDEFGTFLGYYQSDKSYLDNSRIEERNLYSLYEFSYLISSYYFGSNVLSSNHSTELSNLVFDGTTVTLKTDTSSGLTNIFNWIANKLSSIFVDTDYDIPNNYGLGYFDKNLYSKDNNKVLGLYNILYYDNEYTSLSVPDNFLSQSYSYNDRYYIIPNSLTCSNNDSLIYFSSSDYNNVNVVSYTLNDSNLLNNEIKAFSFKTRKANYIEALSLNSYVEKYTDYLYMIYSSDNKSSNLFYYNPSCYSVYSAISNENIEFLNINTNENIIITPSEQKIIYNNVSDVSNSLAVEVKDDVDITSFISSAWHGAKTFLLAALKISTLSTDFFNTLPSEVGSILLCGFTVGLVIILWKIFRS